MPPKPEYFHVLNAKVDVLTDQMENLHKESEDVAKRTDGLKDLIEEIRRDLALIKQQLENQNKRIDEWDRRWWGLIVLLVGALISLASGLIVTLVKK